MADTVVAAGDVIDLYRTALDSVAALTAAPATLCSDRQLTDLVVLQEELSRRVEALTVQRYADARDRQPAPMTVTGSVFWYFHDELNVGKGELKRRGMHADRLATGHTLTGEPMPPKLPDTAEALRAGRISRTHVDVITKVMTKIPGSVDAQTRAAAEATMAEFASQMTPRETEQIGVRLLAHLDPDGQETDDADRARQRYLGLSPQDQRLMSRLTADLTPAARAILELALELFSARGMNNPDDPESPRGAVNAVGLDPHLVAEAAKRDKRPEALRWHDALMVICEYALAAAAAGTTINGLPAQVIVTASKSDIDAGRGFATTATGTTMPVSDVVDLLFGDPENPADTHLVVFDDDTHKVIYYGTGRRTATPAQRFVQFARDRGCTKPACGKSMIHCQSHHIHRWEYGGRTTISNLAAACGRDNRSEGPNPTDWKTVLIHDGPDAGRVGWISPADPSRTPRVNHLHHPDVALARHMQARMRFGDQQQRRSCRNVNVQAGTNGPPPSPPLRE